MLLPPLQSPQPSPLPPPLKARPCDILLSPFRPSITITGVVLTRLMTLQPSLGGFGDGPRVPPRKPISTGGLYLGCQDHMEIQSARPPGYAQNVLIASSSLTHVSSPGICLRNHPGPLSLFGFSVPVALQSFGSLTVTLFLPLLLSIDGRQQGIMGTPQLL